MTNRNEFFKTPAEIFQDMKELAELQDYANAQFEVITSLKKELDTAKQEISHLKHLLSNVPSGSILGNTVISEEEMICLEQIARLKNSSEQRELTLDEVKKLDLLHKNLKLIREKSVIDVKPARQKALTNDKLLELVAKKPVNDE